MRTDALGTDYSPLIYRNYLKALQKEKKTDRTAIERLLKEQNEKDRG